MKAFLILILAFGFITACSIEKRVHQGGYFVQWQTLLKKENKTSTVKENADIEKSLDEVPKRVKEDTNTFQLAAKETKDQNTDEASKTKIPELKTGDVKELDGPISQPVAIEEINKIVPLLIEKGEDKTEAMAVTAFVFSILSFGFLILAGIPAIIMAGTVLLRIKRNPGKYSKKAKILSSIALLISICVVLLSLFFLLYILTLSF